MSRLKNIKIRWLLVLRISGWLLVLYLLLFQNKWLGAKISDILHITTTFFYKYKNSPGILMSYIITIIIGFIIIKIATQRLFKYIKFLDMKPANTYSRGDARWNTKKGMKKGFLYCNMDELYSTGYIVNRSKVYKITLFNKFSASTPELKWFKPIFNKKAELKENKRRAKV